MPEVRLREWGYALGDLFFFLVLTFLYVAGLVLGYLILGVLVIVETWSYLIALLVDTLIYIKTDWWFEWNISREWWRFIQDYKNSCGKAGYEEDYEGW